MTILAFVVLAMFLVYIAVELGWGGSKSDYWTHYPFNKGDPFPPWRPWRPSAPRPPSGPKVKPSPPKLPELVE
jgi:hypothetical protein